MYIQKQLTLLISEKPNAHFECYLVGKRLQSISDEVTLEWQIQGNSIINWLFLALLLLLIDHHNESFDSLFKFTQDSNQAVD